MAKAYNKRVLGRGLSAILNDDDNVHMMIEKYLSFSHQNHMTLTVNSTLYSHDDRTDFLECIEIFHIQLDIKYIMISNIGSDDTKLKLFKQSFCIK